MRFLEIIMKINKLFFASVLLLAANIYASPIESITGAGASFPYPLYAKWAEMYQAKTGMKLNYQAIGSGGGMKQIQAKTVDFGASDKPLSAEELKQNGLIQFPTIIGGITPIVNLANIKPGQLKLTGPVLAGIYLGKIKKWNDPAISALNSNITLPEQDITVVHRSDSSGTSFLFTYYLSQVNPAWKAQVGFDAAVAWPVGVGGKGNSGVASYVQRIPGGIGYVEFAYAHQNQLVYTQLRNKAGTFILPLMKTFSAAAANADWQHTEKFYLLLTDMPGKNSWPITGASFVLMQANQEQATHGKAVLQFFDWAYRYGAQAARDLYYVELPAQAITLIKKSWAKEIKWN